MKYSLNGKWDLSYTDPDGGKVSIGINVPGNVETAMQENGCAGDFMPADDLYSHEKYDWVDDWTFERSFIAPDLNSRERLTLNFEGIDTVAEIYLNGEQIYFADDMFIPHVIDVTDKVKKGENALRVVIRSALLYIANAEAIYFFITQYHAKGNVCGKGGLVSGVQTVNIRRGICFRKAQFLCFCQGGIKFRTAAFHGI